MVSPGRGRGYRSASRRITEAPDRRASIAAAAPAGPPPTTMMSASHFIHTPLPVRTLGQHNGRVCEQKRERSEIDQYLLKVRRIRCAPVCVVEVEIAVGEIRAEPASRRLLRRPQIGI